MPRSQSTSLPASPTFTLTVHGGSSDSRSPPTSGTIIFCRNWIHYPKGWHRDRGQLALEELTDLLMLIVYSSLNLYMKKLLYLGLALLASATFAHATITINLGGGNIYGTSTATLFPAGGLLQLIVSSTDNVFTAPVAGSYTGNSADDVVLASFADQCRLGSPGTFAQPIIFTFTGNIGPGDQILLRWFPTLTLANTTPPAGAPFGQFRTDLIENFSDIAWNLPERWRDRRPEFPDHGSRRNTPGNGWGGKHGRRHS